MPDWGKRVRNWAWFRWDRLTVFLKEKSEFTRDERDFLPAALEILENPPSPVGRAVGLAIISLVGLALIWSIFGKVDIIATARGRIVPIGKTKIIQPVEAGLVRAIPVADGDHVRPGQVLVELNPTESGADRQRYRAGLLQARLHLAKLQGLVAAIEHKSPPVLVDPPKDASNTDLDEANAAMHASWDELNAKIAGIDRQIEEKNAEEAEANAAIEKLKATLPIVREETSILEQSSKSQFGSRLQYLASSEKLAEQEHAMAELTSRRDQARAARNALVQQRSQTFSSYMSDILENLRKARDDAIAFQADFTKAEEKWHEQTLTAPTAGTVQQLAIHTVGGVVTPAQQLMVIVPDDAGLMVEANVENRDVGFVSKGQKAALKIEPFSFTRYGLIDGKVTELSRDTLGLASPQDTPQDQKPASQSTDAGSNYIAHITLGRDWMETENGKVKLGPGMAVTAEIQTGRRRIIDYLLSPLVSRVSESMHER